MVQIGAIIKEKKKDKRKTNNLQDTTLVVIMSQTMSNTNPTVNLSPRLFFYSSACNKSGKWGDMKVC